MVKESNCLWCGKPIPEKGLRRSYCSEECARASKIQGMRSWRALRASEEEQKKAQTLAEPAPVIIKLNTLAMIAKAASDCGMSYGEYVARIDGMK